ncbi:hypothetical protein [Roseobacter ponti]|uniref:Uncharacterized protein n=1 Tax=Roseobacter ponti TaxID=1891787 RepID=A0A858SQI6_9RHOB|nr:hypothetical protein [Roseobacter ponti]QJF50640.1 hypothetical protein G3256_05435 [Roseobacter ponti]
MSDTLYLMALGVLVGGAGLLVWRGTSRKPDDGSNRADIGGGPGDGGMPD